MLLDASPESINERESDGTTPIIEAITAQDERVVRFLLGREAGISLSRQNFLFEREYYAESPLSLAARWSGSSGSAIVHCLLQAARARGIKFPDKGLALLRASGDKEKLEILIADGLTSSDLLDRSMRSWLRSPYVVLAMIDVHADLSVHDGRGYTALHHAVAPHQLPSLERMQIHTCCGSGHIP
jgi:ankyrin repeat protein